jgi:hypothetical protein
MYRARFSIDRVCHGRILARTPPFSYNEKLLIRYLFYYIEISEQFNKKLYNQLYTMGENISCTMKEI